MSSNRSNLLHTIEYVICKCGYYFKVDDGCDELSLMCTHCDKLIQCDFGLTADGIVLSSDEKCNDCKISKLYSKDYTDIYSNEMDNFVQSITTNGKHNILNHIAKRLDTDPELVYKLLQDVVHLESTVDTLQMKLRQMQQHKS
jgi:hypothetical protein